MSYRIVMPPHTNHRGTLFGGMALAWIDEETAITVARVLGNADIVTKAMAAIEFKSPGHVGDIIELDSKVVDVGETSVTVDCSIRNVSTGKEIVKVDKVVYVSVTSDGKRNPHGLTLDKVDPNLIRR